jgi:5-methylthioadenosine/S-adenosylhomocysteine deaminase
MRTPARSAPRAAPSSTSVVCALPDRGPLLLRGGTLVTMDEGRRVRREDLLIEAGRIARIGRGLRAPRGAQVIECAGSAVIPGLVQAHVHLCQVLFRNHADGLELLDWLQQKIWPLEAAHDARSLRFSARLGIAELLLGGTTAVLDMATVRHTEEVLGAALESGLRYVGGKCLMDQGHQGLREGTAAALRETESLGMRWHGRDGGRISYALCPRFVLSCSRPLWDSVRALGEQHGWVVHTHASENRAEVELVREQVGEDSVAWFHSIGLGGPRLVLAHCVHLTAREVREMAKSGAHAVHCPGANLKLASGLADVPLLLAAGVNVALGADGAPCNNTLDALRELRLAATLHLPRSGPRALPASEALAMATINGARALGQQRELGSLEVGKRADVVVLDLTAPHCAPNGPDPHATIAYCARASDVTQVIVDGRWLVRGGELQTLDARALARSAGAEIRRVLRAV